MYMPACDQRQTARLHRLAERAESAEGEEEDIINKCRMYARVGHVICEPLSDEEVYVLLEN